MSDLFGYISSWSFLKWIVLVLIAGFIGQFGKMAAEVMAKKIRLNREKKDIAPVAPLKTRVRQSSPDTPAQQSAPDTLIKPQEQPASPDTPANTPGQQSAPDEITDKKILKSMAKARKKNAKKTIGLVIGSFRKRL